MAPLTLLIAAACCAFLLGFSINQGSTCSVTAAKQLVYKREFTMLAGFAVAIGVAGLICLPLKWALGSTAHVVADHGVSLAVVGGAILLGVGAVINDACLLGTLARIGDGEIRFLGLPFGLGAGFAAADHLSVSAQVALAPNHFAEFDAGGAILSFVFAAILVAAWRRLGAGANTVRYHEWPLRWAMVALGGCGALLFSLAPGWTYADAVRRSVANGQGMTMIGFGALVAAVAALAGAVASGLRSRSFHYQAPRWALVGRSFGGGAVMAIGATLVPGGNDALLLASVPAATLSGVAAFTVMSVTVPLLLIARSRRFAGNTG